MDNIVFEILKHYMYTFMQICVKKKFDGYTESKLIHNA